MRNRPKNFKKWQPKNIQNELFNYKNKVCNSFYKILDEIEKTQDDKEIKEANQFTKNKIEELKKLIENENFNDLPDDDSNNKDDIVEDPAFVYKLVTLAIGLKIYKWLRKDEEYL